ncbi:replication initiator protein A [Staphylococcus chromogenes]|uniref:replication initiator protein A n=1 Tax=Staphylococcus chromogenes TaxID=46126 RepID=UPI001F2E7026|nr:replication initiator protein A [Staphylococcus chromogenes]MCE4962643.1 replication initiator protein A [Staphylococcus chromogenes]
MKNKLQTRICNVNDKKHLPFLKSYKFLFEDNNYQDLPYQAKAMYTYMANKQIRVLKSQHKQAYINTNGQPFIVYTIKDLQDDLNLSNSSVKKYKRILAEYDLISTTHKGKYIYVNTPKLTDDTYTYADGKKLSYYHMPKFFDTNPNYKNVSLLTKLVYTLQKERFTLSLANTNIKTPSQYVDEQGRVFCVYANQALAEMLNVCEKKIIDAKKELEALGLLKQRKQGINESNRLYLYTPLSSEQVTTDDISESSRADNKTKKYALVPPEKSMRGCVYQRLWVKNAVGYGLNMQSSNTGFSNTNYSNTYNSMYSMYNMSFNNQYTEQTDNTNNDFETTRKEMKLKPFNFNPTLKNYLMNFSSSDLGIVLKKLATAKNHYNQNYDTNYSLEDIDDQLLPMLKRVKVVIHDKNSTVSALGGYIYTSTVNEFKAYEIKTIEEQNNNDSETAEEFNARWFEKIKQVSKNLKRNHIDCTTVKQEDDLFSYSTLGYQDDMGMPY